MLYLFLGLVYDYSMSYEVGHHISFGAQLEEKPQSRLLDIGTHITFIKVLSEPSSPLQIRVV
jgi:hypothetical protein